MRCIPYTGYMVRKISVHSENEREGEIMTDYIELKEAIDLFYSIDPENDGSDGGTVALMSDDYTSEEIEEMLSLLPAADVAPVVHGKWEWFGPCYDGNGKFWGTCSVCQTRQRLGDYYTHCPVCGAKMDLEEE